ncbi:MAG TPA: FAD-binding oxidoreductase [Usitatibacter sp.]|nr:FAD-binding oxidoreductase [Usitatibacter sp.]
MSVRSWGNYPKVEHAAVVPLYWRHLELPAAPAPMLPAGLARSYGDSCLNENGTLLATPRLDRLIAFDRSTGVIRCEAGMSLAALIALVLPAGWFLPVVPGTAYVTMGGAIANDVHGKNHHVAGTFGHHVRRFELLRSDGTRTECVPGDKLFRATLGGLGLTGLVTWVELQLVSVPSAFLDVETIRMRDLDHFFALSEASSASHEYTVAWVDAMAQGADVGRGTFMRANFAHDAGFAAPRAGRLSIPFDFPSFALNRPGIALFNALYRARAQRDWKRTREPCSTYLFPLDGIGHWNRMYGARGFLQHQSVVPRTAARENIARMLEEIARDGEASFLSVLKVFGDRDGPGLLSFARPGVTLALDFPMRGPRTLELLDRLDAIVRSAGGAVYPAKDARMSAETFRTSFPRWQEFRAFIDPSFSSSFWRRVAG